MEQQPSTYSEEHAISQKTSGYQKKHSQNLTLQTGKSLTGSQEISERKYKESSLDCLLKAKQRLLS